jgi:protein gp37
MSICWNLWHGCKKYSEGCKYCYVYRGDSKRDKDASIVTKTAKFDLPIQKKKNGEYKVLGGQMIYTCFTSDFLIDEADEWRKDAWLMIKERQDLKFFFITKRIERFLVNLPDDWENGYDNVIVGCTCENQDRLDYRIPILKEMPILHKVIILEPLLEEIDLSKHLDDSIEQVVLGGESGQSARKCDYNWVIKARNACIAKKVSFHFKQTGSNFFKDGIAYKIAWKQMHSQARKADINYSGNHIGYI